VFLWPKPALDGKTGQKSPQNWVRFFGHLCIFIGFFAKKLGSFRNLHPHPPAFNPFAPPREPPHGGPSGSDRAGWIAASRQSTRARAALQPAPVPISQPPLRGYVKEQSELRKPESVLSGRSF